MSLPPGTRFGPYEITAQIGVGGMGEVYRATDTNLKRAVAIKVMPESVAADADRLARFQREAEVLASLNHPNIAQLYGLEKRAGMTALVMELVEGPTLADRIAQGPIPVDDALPIARQIAEAVEAAHEQGIVHRDLKPANIKVRSDGTVKVLDFGLAKALSNSTEHAPQLSTITAGAMTMAGLVLGTAAYMAPEQAAGKPVDRRADIWSFGCLLFEMLTGTRAFEGPTIPETIASVLSREPRWQALPSATPTPIRRLLQRCLVREPRRRLDSAAAARLEIDDALSGTEAIPVAKPRRLPPVWLPVLFGGVLVVGLTIWGGRQPASNAPVTSRLEIVPPKAQALSMSYSQRTIAISPDGRYIVYHSGTTRQLVVRALDRQYGVPVAGITNANHPFFSPDGEWIGYFDGTSLSKVPTAGGLPSVVVAGAAPAFGASWGDDGTIVFASAASGALLRVPAAGGEPLALTSATAADGETRRYPSVLPGGRGVLFTMWTGDVRLQTQTARVAVLDARTGREKILIPDGSQAAWVDPGYLVYLVGRTLRAVRFDLERLEIVSDPRTFSDEPWINGRGEADMAVSRTGTLVYTPEISGDRTLVWVDRRGQELPVAAPPRLYEDVRLSPDGRRAALAIRDAEHDIWIWDFTQGGPLTRFTFDHSFDERPIWTADGSRIVFTSGRASTPAGGRVFNLFVQSADGTGIVERLTTRLRGSTPGFVARDGTTVVGVEYDWGADIVSFPTGGGLFSSDSDLGSGLSPVMELIKTKSQENNPEVSPDGRYIAYQSNESGRFEIWVRPFPNVNAGQWQVSNEGGTRPVWGRDGRELFYLDARNRLTAVTVQTSGKAFVHSRPVALFDIAYVEPFDTEARPFDVAPDGRFLMVKENAAPRLAVVLNSLEELEQRAPTR